MGEDRQERAEKGFPCRLPCGRGHGSLVAWAGGFQGTNTVPLPPVSQFGGPFPPSPCNNNKFYKKKKIEREGYGWE